MGSLKTIPVTRRSPDPISGPRISFSADFLDDKDFISITPKDKETAKDKSKNSEFEFLSSSFAAETMIRSADELFFEGKLLPFGQISKMSVKTEQGSEIKRVINGGKVDVINNREEPKMRWFLEDDPSPRPPKCSVLWKELLNLRKKRGASTLSPSSSTSSSSSSTVFYSKIKNLEEDKHVHVRRMKKGLDMRPPNVNVLKESTVQQTFLGLHPLRKSKN